ncbi:MAG TPA: tRNA lysidine(34) synthetase TilS [Flavisolibacter sp.]|nr:tRNA lysidine(34) synthetase TilS [Flavisolibacter sp.]
MDLSGRFLSFFKQHPLRAGSRLLLAASGGVDSVVLCELCHRAGFPFLIAHGNFGLRGEESDRDEAFVKSLGLRYGVEVITERFKTAAHAEKEKCSIQEAARYLRYSWFFRLREERGLAAVVLAHHADDNIETLLMNFFRGTGLPGLTGMPATHEDGRLLRPLLGTRRSEILRFASDCGLEWVEDSSNSSSKYTRNFFRLQLLPAIAEVYPKVEDNLLDNIGRMQKIEALYLLSVRQLKEKLCKKLPSEIRIPVKELMRYSHTSLIYEIITDYGFGEKQVGEVIKLATAPSGRFIQNEAWQLIKHRNWFILAPRSGEAPSIAIEEEEKTVLFAGGLLSLRRVSKERSVLQTDASIAQVDAKLVKYPLLLRKWKEGDYFYPFGQRKKKKLARFFIDQKLPKNRKEAVWVLESDQRIVWVVGMRIDDRFRLTDATQSVLEITYQRTEGA